MCCKHFIKIKCIDYYNVLTQKCIKFFDNILMHIILKVIVYFNYVSCCKFQQPQYNDVSRQHRVHWRYKLQLCLRPFTHYTVPHQHTIDVRKNDRCFRRNRSYDINAIMQSCACAFCTKYRFI